MSKKLYIGKTPLEKFHEVAKYQHFVPEPFEILGRHVPRLQEKRNRAVMALSDLIADLGNEVAVISGIKSKGSGKHGFLEHKNYDY